VDLDSQLTLDFRKHITENYKKITRKEDGRFTYDVFTNENIGDINTLYSSTYDKLLKNAHTFFITYDDGDEIKRINTKKVTLSVFHNQILK
jgi:hypothetical protein